MSDNIQIHGNFDGGNPQDTDAIIQTGGNAFTVRPFSEDGDANYKFRLDIKAINRSRFTHNIDLRIDWQEPRFNHLRDYVYLKNLSERDWTRHPLIAGTEDTAGSITLKPGETHITLNPSYNYADYLDLVNRIPMEGPVIKELVGKTSENRELWALKTRGTGSAVKKRIMLVARIHPYETAGSYCVEGIFGYLLRAAKDKSVQLTRLRNKEICIIPMANPDGVYNGLCKLTRLKGEDFSKSLNIEDRTTLLLMRAIDDFQPDTYCEFHNWMLPSFDGIYYLGRLQAWRFIKRIPSQKKFQKKWRFFVRRWLFPTAAHGFKKYCRERFGSTSLCVEYPWYLRSTEDMRMLGAQTLGSLCRL